MIVRTSNKGRLKIDVEPLQRMAKYAQDDYVKPEAGGLLMGRFILNSKDIVVDRVTVPMVGDQRGRKHFVRAEKRHQGVLERAWRKSGGTCNYLGEWHTHPERVPSPSWKDEENWQEIMTTRQISSLYLYFVIVGTVETRVWEGNSKTGKIKRLRQI